VAAITQVEIYDDVLSAVPGTETHAGNVINSSSGIEETTHRSGCGQCRYDARAGDIKHKNKVSTITSKQE
jgi:hypothetical protein